MTRTTTIALLLLSLAPAVEGFSNTIFQESVTAQRTAPSKIEGVEIELPNFDELFERIQQVSPLARVAMSQQASSDEKGFQAIQDNELKWKTIEQSKKHPVHEISKIDNFQGLGAPILRFRCSLKGPCVSDAFANFIMDLEERKKWDAQIADVRELYPIHDLDAANIAMGFGKYGDCSRLGVGYCQTKAAFGVSPREQLTMCGIQDFRDGSTVIWGTEMEDWHNDLLPGNERHVRAKSHIFATTLVPTSDDSFDVEYVLQMNLGGNLPGFLTTPVISDTVKSLFVHAKKFYSGKEGSALEDWIEEQMKADEFLNRHSILMPH